MRLGLAVSAATLDGGADSQVLLAAAAAAGVPARMIDWRSGAWDDVDAVLLHTPWDYTDDVEEFSAWLQSLSERTSVFNSYASTAANLHKSYLLDLATAGLPLPLTRLVRAGSDIDLEEMCKVFGSSPVVAKPAAGAGGRRLIRLATVEDLASCALMSTPAVAAEDVIVQAFVPAIEADGEYSLVFIAGEPSHLIHKAPAAEQFSVQARYGGTERRVDLDTDAVRVAELLRPRVGKLAYARIDYVRDANRGPLLMELELTEPDLFLRHAPGAAEALIHHIRTSQAPARTGWTSTRIAAPVSTR